MDEKTLARELEENPAFLREAVRSRDAQALLEALNREDGFREAVRAAADGDSGELAQRLRAFSRTPGGAALLSRLERTLERNHGGL